MLAALCRYHPTRCETVPRLAITIKQEHNYSRAALAWLPTITIAGANDPVIQVIDEYNDEVVYTLRIKGASFRPKVFREGSYTVKIGEGVRQKVLEGIQSIGFSEQAALEVRL